MIEVNIPESDMKVLNHERFHHPHPRVMLKMDVLYLKGLKFPNEDICKIADICGNTMREYFKQYIEGGIERLKEVNFYRPSSDLQEYSGTMEEYFKEHPPASIAHASSTIEKMTGIKRGETQTRKFLKSMKFRYIKSCSVPAKALTEEKFILPTEGKTNSGSFWRKNLNPD